MSSERQCHTCGGDIEKNGPASFIDGEMRQFYRCQGDCRLGGWISGEHNYGNGTGPVFEGLHGDHAPTIACGKNRVEA